TFHGGSLVVAVGLVALHLRAARAPTRLGLAASFLLATAGLISDRILLPHWLVPLVVSELVRERRVRPGARQVLSWAAPAGMASLHRRAHAGDGRARVRRAFVGRASRVVARDAVSRRRRLSRSPGDRRSYPVWRGGLLVGQAGDGAVAGGAVDRSGRGGHPD